MSEVDEAVRAALDGRLIVLPTDTVYGIGTRPDEGRATALVFEAKRRPPDLDLPVLVSSIPAAEEIAEVGAPARRLMEAFWPGPLTIVLPRTEMSRDWQLGGDPETIGVRRPRHLLALAVLERTGPLAVTSANLSGHPTPSTCEELVELFADAVAVYLCEPEPLEGRPSTVVDLAHGEPRIVREGALGEAALNVVLSG